MLRGAIGLFVLAVVVWAGVTEAMALGLNYRGPFEGRVIDAGTGEPIEGAVVFIEWTISHALRSSSFFDTAEVRTDSQGLFYIPKNWSWNPLRTMFMDSQYFILKAGYSSVRAHWGPILDAKAILESLPVEEREKPGAGCGYAVGESKWILHCADPDVPTGYPTHIKNGQAVFHLKKTLPTGFRQSQFHYIPDHKRQMLLEEIRKDNALAVDGDGPSQAIGQKGGRIDVPFPKDHRAP